MEEINFVDLQSSINIELDKIRINKSISSITRVYSLPKIINKNVRKKLNKREIVNKMLQKLFKVPVVGYLAEITFYLFRLPRQITRMREEINQLYIELAKKDEHRDLQIRELNQIIRSKASDMKK